MTSKIESNQGIIALLFGDKIPIGDDMPICKRCNHSKCPHCSDWCDVIATTKEQIKEYGVVTNETLDEYKMVLCCEGTCTY